MAISRRDVLKRSAALGALSTGLAAPAIAQAPVTLTVMTYESLPATQRVLQEHAAAFGAANPGVTVNPTFSSGEALRTQVASMLQSGIAPDVVMLDLEDTLLYSRNNLLEPVSDIVSAIPGIPDRWRARPDGQDYYVPVGIKFTYTFYRADLFQAAGLTAPRTWAEMQAAAARFTSGGQFGYLVSSAETFDYPVSQLMSYGYANGVNFIDDDGNVVFDQGDNKAALAETLAFLKTMSRYSPSGTNLQWGAVIDAYTSGRVAMADFIGARLRVIARQNNPPVGEATRVIRLPQGRVAGNRLSAQGYLVFRNGRNKEQAKTLVRFLTQQQRNMEFLWSTSMHVLPASADTFRASAYRDHEVVRAQPDVLQVVEDSWDAAHNPVYDLAGRRANWQRVRVFTSTVYNKIVSSVIQGDTAPAAAIDEGAAAARALLRRG